MGLFSRKKEDKTVVKSAYERMLMVQLEDEDEEAADLINKLREGHPLVLNFDKLDVTSANKFLAFFSGACYVLGAKNIKINETTYLFARSEEFNDGSLNEFLDELDEN